MYHRALRENQIQEGPPRWASNEDNEPQRGKIRAFINLDDIPDEYSGLDVGRGIDSKRDGYSSSTQQPSSHIHAHSDNAMYGERDSYPDPQNTIIQSYTNIDRTNSKVIPKLSQMRSMQPDPNYPIAVTKAQRDEMREQQQQRLSPPPLPASARYV